LAGETLLEDSASYVVNYKVIRGCHPLVRHRVQFSSITNSITLSTTPQFSVNSILKMDEPAIQEAIDALNSHQFTSRRATTRHFGVDRDTLGRWINGTLSRQQAHEKEQNLSYEEEQFLLAWIQAEDLASTPSTYARIRAMANIMYQHQTTP
jgi:hypothetical protein